MSGISKFNHTGDFLASIVNSLDSQVLRIQSSNLNIDEQFISVFPLKDLQKGNLHSIEWIGSNTSLEDQYLGLCFENGTFTVYSPVLNEIIDLKDTFADCLHYSKLNDKLFGYSNDLKEIFEWDVNSWLCSKKLKVDFIDEKINLISSYNTDKIILGSHCLYVIDITNGGFISIPSHVSRLTKMVQMTLDSVDYLITSAKGDRFINMIKLSESNTIDRIFVCDSDVLKFEVSSLGEHSILSVITQDGIVETFNDIMTNKLVKGSSRRKVNSIKSDYKLKLTRNNNLLELNDLTIINKEILISYFEDNNILLIERIQWLDQTYLINEDRDIVKIKENIKLQQQFSKFGHDKASNKLYHESHAVVMQGDDFQDLNNMEVDGEEDGDFDSFKDIIDKANENEEAVVKKHKKGNKVTLVVILNQAIKSNDDSLLEIVLNNKDEEIIRNTIKKLDSEIIIKLLNKLSEKIMRNKNRLINLNYWIKNILIYHSGWLINNLNSNSKNFQNLSILIRLLNDKSKNLNKLIELRGKIDILNERLTIKKELNLSIDYEINEENDYEIENLEDIEYIEDFEDLEEDSDSDIDSDSDEAGHEVDEVDEDEGDSDIDM